uniref:Uncharacterized protein n=1 Tax=Myotis myotis TaxID=51298 RepID=A0A7J7RS15_MYOMY|nr:hypothetical protein mMyoMyo1_010238 [Myotis myotis]
MLIRPMSFRTKPGLRGTPGSRVPEGSWCLQPGGRKAYSCTNFVHRASSKYILKKKKECIRKLAERVGSLEMCFESQGNFHFKFTPCQKPLLRSVVANRWSSGHWWSVRSERLATAGLDALADSSHFASSHSSYFLINIRGRHKKILPVVLSHPVTAQSLKALSPPSPHPRPHPHFQGL